MSPQFDPLVIRAMARWPDVPAVFGWLRLDPRGNWLLIDRGQPGFSEQAHGTGSPITNPAIIDFIGRNYAHDSQGRWFWQNGPQRVFVKLDRAPWVIRVIGSGPEARLITHTGVDFGAVESAAFGPAGEILLNADQGCGVVHDLDACSLQLDDAGDAEAPILVLGKVRLPLQRCTDPEREFGFVTRPAAP